MVIVIIAILAAVTLTVVSVAQREAKVQRTRSTIAKLDAAVGDIYEKYEDRRLGLTVNTFAATPGYRANVSDAQKKQVVEAAKLHVLREIMRMEMPSKYQEIEVGPIVFQHPYLSGTWTSDDIPAVRDFYLKAFNPSGVTGTPPNATDLDSAECLYLIMANLNPAALENFKGNEIGDYDNDGLLEFHDAWGQPIAFFRYAPGLIQSDRQPDVVSGTELTKAGDWEGGPNHSAKWNDDDFRNNHPRLIEAVDRAITRFPDPLIETSYVPRKGWYTYPLIISMGPDKEFGIYRDPDVSTSDPFASPVGMPVDGSDNYSEAAFHDNVHNHQR